MQSKPKKDMKLENEKALIRTIAEGNTKSFEVLFYSYYPRLKGFICDLLQSPEEAEDISQDIFTTLWQNRTRYELIISKDTVPISF